MEMIEEVWKPIPGFELGYEVSNLGRVRSLYREYTNSRGQRRHVDGGLLKLMISKGYYRVGLRDLETHKKKMFGVHRLVAICFVEGDITLTVNHIDGNKLNNIYTNLEFISATDNIKHAWDNNLSNYQEKSLEKLNKINQRNSWKNIKVIYPTGEVEMYNSVEECANGVGYNKSTVYDALSRGKQPSRCQIYGSKANGEDPRG